MPRKDVMHAVILPTYRTPIEVLHDTLGSPAVSQIVPGPICINVKIYIILYIYILRYIHTGLGHTFVVCFCAWYGWRESVFSRSVYKFILAEEHHDIVWLWDLMGVSFSCTFGLQDTVHYVFNILPHDRSIEELGILLVSSPRLVILST